MKNKEIWKPVKGYEDLYEVSDLGRVRSLNYGRSGETKERKARKNKNGYLQVGLWKDGKRKMNYVHRLVYEAFRGRVPEGLVINHLDENPANNWLDNLEVCTQKKNLNYGTRNERAAKAMIGKHVNRKDKSKPVCQIDIVTGKILNTYPSGMEAHRQTGINNRSISSCCLSNRTSAGGYKWRYAEDVNNKKLINGF